MLHLNGARVCGDQVRVRVTWSLIALNLERMSLSGGSIPLRIDIINNNKDISFIPMGNSLFTKPIMFSIAHR